MNNRQAGLIAAAGLGKSIHDTINTGRFFEAWLDELDAAAAEARIPSDPKIIAEAITAGRDLELSHGVPITRIRVVDSRPEVELVNGNAYQWYGSSWSRMR